MFRLALVFAAAAFLANPGYASESQLSESQKKEVTAAAFQVVIAYQCRKRFDDQEILEFAKQAAVKIFSGNGYSDPEGIVNNIGNKATEDNKKSGGFSLASQDICSNLK